MKRKHLTVFDIQACDFQPINRNMKTKLLTIFFLMICAFFSCTVFTNSAKKQEKESEYMPTNVIHNSKLSRAFITDDIDSLFYFCYSHYSSIWKKKRLKTRKICTCELGDSIWIGVHIGDYVRIRKGLPIRGIFASQQHIIFYDSSFVSNYILSLLEKEEDRKILKYTLLNANDSTFKDVIDFEHKVIINENAYYYPIKSRKLVVVYVDDFDWFKSIIPKEKWIYYNQSCYCENVSKYLLIPLLDNVNE